MSEEMFYNLLLLFAEAGSKIKRAPCQDMDLYLRYGLVFKIWTCILYACSRKSR